MDIRRWTDGGRCKPMEGSGRLCWLLAVWAGLRGCIGEAGDVSVCLCGWIRQSDQCQAILASAASAESNGSVKERIYSILSNWQLRPAFLSIFNYSLLSTGRFYPVRCTALPQIIWLGDVKVCFFHHCSVLGLGHFTGVYWYPQTQALDQCSLFKPEAHQRDVQCSPDRQKDRQIDRKTKID